MSGELAVVRRFSLSIEKMPFSAAIPFSLIFRGPCLSCGHRMPFLESDTAQGLRLYMLASLSIQFVLSLSF